ncbi:MAG: hypothetical protein AAF939_17595 [Planctomycetota bacterium]
MINRSLKESLDQNSDSNGQKAVWWTRGTVAKILLWTPVILAIFGFTFYRWSLLAAEGKWIDLLVVLIPIGILLAISAYLGIHCLFLMIKK